MENSYHPCSYALIFGFPRVESAELFPFQEGGLSALGILVRISRGFQPFFPPLSVVYLPDDDIDFIARALVLPDFFSNEVDRVLHRGMVLAAEGLTNRFVCFLH